MRFTRRAALGGVVALGLSTSLRAFAHPGHSAPPAAPKSFTALFEGLEADIRDHWSGRADAWARAAILDLNGVVWAQAYAGHGADQTSPQDWLDRPAPVFDLGKPMLASAAARLSQAGRIALNAPLTLSAFGRTVLSPRGEGLARATLAQLLSHGAGLPFDAAGAEPVRQVAPAGTGFAYSDLGYRLAGVAIAQAVEAPLSDILRAEVFAPLGITQARLDAEGRVGSMTAGLAALCRFAQGLLQAGTGSSDWLSAEALAVMARQVWLTDPPLGGYGLGLSSFPAADSYGLGHSGGQGEAAAVLTVYPEYGLGYTALASDGASFAALAGLDAVLDQTIAGGLIQKRATPAGLSAAEVFSARAEPGAL
ncbi:MAG: serine hydrolase domain-containing protein [Maricaulaceae bacterium]